MKPVLNWVFPGASPRARADSLFSTNSNTRSRKVLPSCAAQVLRRLNSGSGRSRVVRMASVSHKNIFVRNGFDHTQCLKCLTPVNTIASPAASNTPSNSTELRYRSPESGSTTTIVLPA